MKPLRFISFADLHFCPEHADEALASLATLEARGRLEEIDFWTFSGDLCDRGLQNSTRDRFPELVAAIKRLLDIAPMVAIRGTVTHDVAGAYDVLEEIKARHPLIMLLPRVPWFLHEDGAIGREERGGETRALFLGIPEPGKSWLLAKTDGLSSAEASQAVVDAMRELLLGLGGLRRQYPTLATTLLYHGAIKGATMGSGQTIGGDLSIGRDDLEMVGADVVLAGHIHEPQDIASRVFYTGSCYPVDWAETTQRTFMYVELLGPGMMPVVQRIPFPHPPRVKLVTSADGIPADFDDNPGCHGKQTWLVVRDTAERLAAATEEEWLADLVRFGALPGSRVTFEEIPVETVRAAEITEQQSIGGKIVVYGQASSPDGVWTCQQSVLDKAEQLEAEAHASGAVGQGAHIRLQRLRLRGAIGIWAGLGLDEIDVNLDEYPGGLIALVGPNGAGKSTFIENLHVYPEMLTRGGSLQSHFRLKDSARELWFVDEATGVYYRALILIDPTLATPKAEYHLYKSGGVSVPWIPITEGRKEQYVEAIESLWGSIDLFLRSAFVSQKPAHGHPDLADATPAERKSLFRELLGLDYLQGYADRAKARGDAEERSIVGMEAGLRLLTTEIERIPEVTDAIARKTADYNTACEKQNDIERRGKLQKSLVGDLELQVVEQREYVERRRGLTDEALRLALELSDIEKRRLVGEKAVKGLEAAEAIIHDAEALVKRKGELSEDRAKVSTRREEISSQHARALAAHRRDRDAVQAEIRRLEKAAGQLETRKAGIVAQVETVALEAAKPIDATCPTCGQELPGEKRAELIEARTRKQAALAEFQETIIGLDNLLRDNAEEFNAQQRKHETMPEPAAPELPTFAGQAELDATAAKLAALNTTAARETVKLADQAAADMEAGRKRRVEITIRQGAIDKERRDLLAKIDETIAGKHAEAKAEYDRLQRAYVEARSCAAALNAEVEGFTRELTSLNEKAEAFTSLKEDVVKARSELADWRYLERACGRDGIQALELDAAGPAIAREANGLLEAAGIEQRIEIRTTRIAGKGKSTRSVEDFELIVHSPKGEQPLDTLSGGEGTWVKKAIYDAFAAIRAKTTGTKFLTVIQDESDGALDPEARIRYIRMIEAAHVAAGRHHTIIVTHSETAQQMIAQRIEMSDLVRAKEAATA